MTPIRPVRAVLFDLDGTLVDSEMYTGRAVDAVAARHGIAGFTLPVTETQGRTWGHIADEIRARTGIRVPAQLLAAEMLAEWNAVATIVEPIPGATEAVRAAATRELKLGVVSSSPRSVIDSFLRMLGIEDCVEPRARIGGDAVQATKPDPEGFLLAARALDAAPAETLVFEDSRAGLLAARAAGMRSIFVSCRASNIAENTALATAACVDYRALPPDFWNQLRSGSCDLGPGSFK
jgi:sugar-phosphatase